MLLKGNQSKQVYILLFIVLNFGCKEKTYSQNEGVNKGSIINCYITKPVKSDSKADTIRDFEFTKKSLDDVLSNIISSKNYATYDSVMDYVTSYERQKLIFMNNQCYERLSKPDSCNLMNIYFNSGYRTKIMTKSIVEFIQSYKKNIYKFGDATVFEYRFKGVAEVEPHWMYIILKEQTEDEQRYGSDYKGFIICSDGLDWKDYTSLGFSIPLFKQMIRLSKEIYIPLYYDGERFIPIGHFKSNNWHE
jgi:hypothetical protein